MKPADLLPARVTDDDLRAVEDTWGRGACIACMHWPCICEGPYDDGLPEPTADDVRAVELAAMAPRGDR